MKTMRSQCAIQDIKIMRRNHDEASLPAEQAAANALLGLDLADEMMDDVNNAATNRLVSILPPWQPQDMAMVETADAAIVAQICILKPEHSIPHTIQVSNWSDIDEFESEDSNDDISLYLGVERYFESASSYKDLSNISIHEVSDSDATKHEIFPVLLHKILSCGRYNDCISWFPHGRAFVILDQEKFFREVCHLYFCTYEFELFMRWIERYGFQTVDYCCGGKRTVAIFHKRFLRSRKWLAYTMKPILSSRYHRDDIPISSSMDCAQEVFWYLYQLPVVQDMTYLAPVIHRSPPVYQYQYYSQGDLAHLQM